MRWLEKQLEHYDRWLRAELDHQNDLRLHDTTSRAGVVGLILFVVAFSVAVWVLG